MSPAELHADSIVIDGLIIAKWNRELFEDMRKGGLTAANCTVSVWEGFQATVNNIAASQKLIRENSDLVMPVRTTADIRKAKEQGKTGILFGFQNAHAYEDQIGYVEVFKQLGVGIVQMCYNTQNPVGTGCYERDGGLSGFGREIVAEMNRVGVMCDLSHVGSKTSEEVILESKKPVCYSHCLPSGLKEHPRNKSDEELKFIADHGGFVGVTMFAPFLAKGIDSTIDDYAEAIEYVMNIVGEDAIGIGTDFTQGHGQDFFEIPDPRQGLRPPPDQLRQDHQPAGHPHRGRVPEPHRNPAQARPLRASGAQDHGRKLGKRPQGRLGRVSHRTSESFPAAARAGGNTKIFLELSFHGQDRPAIANRSRQRDRCLDVRRPADAVRATVISSSTTTWASRKCWAPKPMPKSSTRPATSPPGTGVKKKPNAMAWKASRCSSTT